MSEPTTAPSTADGPIWRLISVLLGAGAGFGLVVRPEILADAAPLPRRIALALLLLGLVGSLSHGFGLRSARRQLFWLTDPRLAWPLLALGFLVSLAVPL